MTESYETFIEIPGKALRRTKAHSESRRKFEATVTDINDTDILLREVKKGNTVLGKAFSAPKGKVLRIT
jgi:phage terminase large subunit GpA-like protein